MTMITTEDVKRLGIHNLAKLNEELKKKIEVLESELQHAREKLEQEIQYNENKDIQTCFILNNVINRNIDDIEEFINEDEQIIDYPIQDGGNILERRLSIKSGLKRVIENHRTIATNSSKQNRQKLISNRRSMRLYGLKNIIQNIFIR